MADRGKYCHFEFTEIASCIEKPGTRVRIQCEVLKSKWKVSGQTALSSYCRFRYLLSLVPNGFYWIFFMQGQHLKFFVWSNINSQLDATIKNFIDNYNHLNMFRAIISPILRSTSCGIKHRRCWLLVTKIKSRQHRRCFIPQAVLLRTGEIIPRNMLSWS